MSTPPAKFNDLADSIEAGEVVQRLAMATSEVRALGRRAAEAAQEINALICASSHQGPQGVDLAKQAGWALAQLAEQVAQINSLILEIAASAQEQGAGLLQVRLGRSDGSVHPAECGHGAEG